MTDFVLVPREKSTLADMIERVAENLYDFWFLEKSAAEPWADMTDERKTWWLELARTSILPLREEDLRRVVAFKKFEKSYREVDGCWIWEGGLDRRNGYGRFYSGDGVTRAAHQFSYEWYRGNVQPGMVVDHKCRNRLCVNPEHLRTCTNAENVLIGDGITARNAVKTSCKRGHELSGSNLYINPKGFRVCRACQVERARRSKAKIRTERAEAKVAR